MDDTILTRDYINISENIDTISIGHRVAIKTSTNIIYDLFFEEYIEPIIVVKRNRRIKKYDISNSELFIFKKDETKEFIMGIKDNIDNINLNDKLNINNKSVNDTETININYKKCVTPEKIDKKNIDKVNNIKSDIRIVREIINSILEKIEIMEIIKRFK